MARDDIRPEEKSPLERLEGDIRYKRAFSREHKEGELSSHDIQLPSSWKPAGMRKPFIEETFASAFFTRFLWASFIFFLIAVGISAFILLRGANIISSANVDLLISGPVAIEAGQDLSLQIVIDNKNSVPLQNVKLITQYPDGTFDKDDATKPVTLVTTPLDDIAPGQSVNEVAEALVFGEKGSSKDIKIGIEYTVAGSNATLKNEKDFTVNINSSPLSLTVDTLTQVNAGQEFTINATVTSNANVPVKDVMLQAAYPFGFSYLGADPAPTIAQNRWYVGDLAPGQSKTISIRGVVQGQDTENKVFRLSTGTRSTDDPGSIGSVYSATTQTVAIAQPFLGISLSLNNSGSSDVVSNPGQAITGTISWHNNLSTTLTDTRISSQLLGSVHDKTTVVVPRGFYHSDTDLISWDKTTFPDIDTINPQDTGQVTFSLKPKPLVDSAGNVIKNPVIGVTVSITSRRISETGVPEDIHNTAQGKVRINSQVSLTPSVLYYNGPFKNTGPLPPKPDQETTYTVTLSLANTSNDVQNGVVTATLPPYVTWKGVFSPSTEDISYDDLAGQVVWKPGTIPAATGYLGTAQRQVSFQVGLKPSVTQANSIPTLLQSPTFQGLDTFTGQTLRVPISDVSNRRIGDARSTDQDAVVAPN